MKRILWAGLFFFLASSAKADLHGPSGGLTNNSSISSGTITTFNASSATITHILGTTTNDNATIGSYGEYFSSSPAASVTGGSSNVFVNIATVTLTAGDWDISGVGSESAGTTVTLISIALSQFSGNTLTDQVLGDNQVNLVIVGGGSSLTLPGWRQSLSATTIIYLKGLVTDTGGSPVWGGRISARRVR